MHCRQLQSQRASRPAKTQLWLASTPRIAHHVVLSEPALRNQNAPLKTAQHLGKRRKRFLCPLDDAQSDHLIWNPIELNSYRE